MISLKDIPDRFFTPEELREDLESTDWTELLSGSYWHGVGRLLELMQRGETSEAILGAKALMRMLQIDVENKVEEELVKLMTELIPFMLEENTYRTSERWHYIVELRQNITYLAKRYDFITDEFVKNYWQKATESAFINAADDIGAAIEPFELTWEEVFEQSAEDYE